MTKRLPVGTWTSVIRCVRSSERSIFLLKFCAIDEPAPSGVVAWNPHGNYSARAIRWPGRSAVFIANLLHIFSLNLAMYTYASTLYRL